MYWNYFDEQPLNPHNFTSNDILRNFATIFKTKDHILFENIDSLESNNFLKCKEKKYYNYVLVRKSALRNLREIGEKSLNLELDIFPLFMIFLLAVFYIGKGCARRDLSHIRETLKLISEGSDDVDVDIEYGGKLHNCITEMADNDGVIIVTGFCDSSHYMSHFREAAMIEYIGLDKLTNKDKGVYFGASKEWSSVKRKNFGLLALFTIFKNYLNDGSNGIQLDSLFYRPNRRRIILDCPHTNFCCTDCKHAFT